MIYMLVLNKLENVIKKFKYTGKSVYRALKTLVGLQSYRQ